MSYGLPNKQTVNAVGVFGRPERHASAPGCGRRVIECEHVCTSMRGILEPGKETLTSAVRGRLRDPATRAEAMRA